MSKKIKNTRLLMKWAKKEVPISIVTLVIFTQTLIVLSFIPSVEMEDKSVLTANIQDIIDIVMD